MDSKRRMLAWLWTTSVVMAAVLVIVVGCALEKDENRPQGVFNRIGGHGNGQVLQPKRCVIKVAILKRPFRDPAINEIIWRNADEQILASSERRSLETNGLRVGRLIGDLPIEIEAIMQDEAPQKKVTPIVLDVESGDFSLVSSSPPVDQVSLIVSRDNRVTGKDYRNASGFFRVTPEHDGTNAVSLRLVPEIHYGDIQKTWQAAANGGQGPQEFTTRFGQPEDVFRELAVNLVLEPNQVAVIGCKTERSASLGSFLMTQNEPNSDQKWQKLILVWASRNMSGVMAEKAKASDRPKRTKRKSSLFPEPEERPNRRPIPKELDDDPLPLTPMPPATSGSGADGNPPPAELPSDAGKAKSNGQAQPSPAPANPTSGGSTGLSN
jgi:hypothetical protein